ncbi:DUF4465 domain-containing protein [Schlesneria sp. DSM 10557]|uniref:DUF4465 domain-containing protein n=1 Tax=Schlesneria sp. DSM 10557 TaxID=3044399 RepID=UPI0035A18520
MMSLAACFSKWALSVAVVLATMSAVSGGEIVATFQDLPLSAGSHGPPFDAGGVVVPGGYSPEIRTDFVTSGVTLSNFQDQGGSGFWHGFSYSNEHNTVDGGYLNQFSVFAPGDSSSNQFGVAFGYDDISPNVLDPVPFNPMDVSALRDLPHFSLPTGATILSAQVANTTYAALSMLWGDSFAKAFGGASGNDPDFLMLSAYGTDADGNVLSTSDGQSVAAISAEFFLADYRFADQTLDYVIADWTLFDLSSLAGASTIYFNLSSSDTGPYGMNTPAYFAIDNITYAVNPAAVPEPGSLILLLSGGAGLFIARNRRLGEGAERSSVES